MLKRSCDALYKTYEYTRKKIKKEELHEPAEDVRSYMSLRRTRARSAAKRSPADVLDEEANTRFERVSRHERMVAASEIAASSLSKRRLFDTALS